MEVGAAVEAGAVMEALGVVQEILNEPSTNWTEERLERLLHNHCQRLLSQWETAASVADFIEQRLLEGFQPEEVATDLEMSMQVAPGSMAEQMEKLAMQPELIVLCGDMEVLPAGGTGLQEVAPAILAD